MFTGVACDCDGPGEPGEGEGEGEAGEGEGEGEPVAALTIAPTVQNFGDVVVGETSVGSDFTVSNAGEAGSQTGTLSATVQGDFLITDSDCSASLGVGETCTVSVQFGPSTTGARSGSLNVSAGDLSVAAALSGTGQDDAVLVINPSTANFGSVVVNAASNAQTITVTNDGDGDTGALTATLGGADGTQFQLGANACDGATLASGESCTVEVTFEPDSSGNKVASLTVSGSPGGSVNADLNGLGLDDAELAINPASRNFGTVTVGASSTELSFTITNTGDVDSGALGQTISGADAAEFDITASECDGAVLAPNASCTVSITFSPVGAAGARAASLEVDGAPGGTVQADLSGTAAAIGDITMDPTAADFGDIVVGGASLSETFTVTNGGGSATGPLAVVLSGVDSAQFPIVPGGNGCQGVALAAGASCTIAITFNPTGGGDRAASLTVTGVPGGSANAALTGFGLDPADLQLNPTGIDFGSIAQGAQSGNIDIIVTNIGDVPSGTPTAILGGANFNQFTLVNSGCTAPLAPLGTCTVTVRYNPIAQAAHNATITVSATPGGSEVTLLTGVGISPSALAFDVNGGAAAMGTIVIGQTGTPRAITIINNGQETSGVITTTLIGAGASNFTLTENCNTLTAGATCTATVTFVPAVPAGTKVAQLSVSANPGAVIAITTGDLTGTALDKLTSNPATHNFNDVRIGTAVEQQFVLTQTVGGAASGVLTVTTNSAEFVVIAPVGGGLVNCVGANLAVGGTCSTRIRFTPVGNPGARTANLTVTNAGTASTAVVAMTANALGALQIASDEDDDTVIDAAELDDAIRDFGNQIINTSSGKRRLFFTNTSAAATGALSVSLTGGANFIIAEDTCSGATLAGTDGAACDLAAADGSPGPNGAGNGGAGCADTCAVRLWFVPGTPGAKTGTVTVSGNPGNSVVGTVNGNGITPASLDIAPSSFTFAATQETANSATQVFTVTNTGQSTASGLTTLNVVGGNAGDFQIIGGAGVPAPGVAGAGTCSTSSPAGGTVLCNGGVAAGCAVGSVASCTVIARFSPSAKSASTTAKTTALTVAAATGGTDSSTLTGVSTPRNSINPTANNFGNVVTGSGVNSANATFTITNNGGAPTGAQNVTITPAVGTAAGDFTVVGTSNCQGNALPIGGSCTVVVRLNAPALGALAGARSAVLTVDGATETVSATLTGAVQDRVNMSVDPTARDFGSVLQTQLSPNATVTVRNSGDITSGAITATLVGGDTTEFQIVTNGCTTLGPDATCQIVTRFNPAGAIPAGARATTLAIATAGANVGNPALNVALSGEALVGGSVSVAPSSFDFADTVSGQNSANATFTVTNNDGVTSGAISFSTTGNFALVAGGTCVNGGTLTATASCTQLVRFSPVGAAGPRTGTFLVQEAGGNAADATLNGNALDAAVLVLTAPGGVDPLVFAATGFGTSSAPAVFTAVNNGDVATGTLSGPVFSGADAARFAVSANTCTGTLDANETCTFNVTFNPVATGIRNAVVTLTAGALTDAVAVQGNGLNPALLSINPTGNFNFGNAFVNATTGCQNDADCTQIYTVSNDTGAANAGPLVFSLSNEVDFDIVTVANGISVDSNIAATLAPNGDEDVFVVTNATAAAQLVDFSAAGCAGDPVFSIRNAAGGLLAQNDDSIGLCSFIGGFNLAAGQTVFLHVTDFGDNGGLVTYTAQINFPGGGAPVALAETEPNEDGTPQVGGDTFNGNDFSIANANFASNDCVSDAVNGTVLVGADTCTIGVRFNPAGPPGAESNTLSITANPGAVAALTTTQSGTAVSQLSLVVTTNFLAPDPDVSAGDSRTALLTATNNGNVRTGTVSMFLQKGTEFSLSDNNCSGLPVSTPTGNGGQQGLPPGDSCTITAHYRPTTAGTDTAVVTVSATPGDSASVTLSDTSVP